jgi:hypothetical protein
MNDRTLGASSNLAPRSLCEVLSESRRLIRLLIHDRSTRGATITGPQQDLNLGITTFVNGAQMNPVQIDTSTVATDTIDYVATDQSGLTSTSTRTVIVVAPTATGTSTTSTEASSTTDTDSTTQATATTP